MDIPTAWKTAAQRIIRQRWRKVMVVGATDRGKSTFCRYLLAEMTAANLKPAFVDADVGQKDVGPPATVSLAHIPPLGMTEAKVVDLYFVGDVNPMRHFLGLLVGTKRMVTVARADCVVIDTTGLIHGPGRALKAAQIDSLQPDVIVALERGYELATIVNEHRHHNIIRLHASRYAKGKSSQARKTAREAAFARYFQGATDTTLDLERIVVQRAPLLNGTPVADPRFVYAEKTAQGLVGVSRRHEMRASSRLVVLPLGFEHNLLCGLVGRRGQGLGLGIIRKIEFAEKSLRVTTTVAKSHIRLLQFGDIYVSADGRELGRRGF